MSASLTRELSSRGLAVDVYTRSQDPAKPRIDTGGGALGPNGRVIHLPAGPQRPYHRDLIYDHLPAFVAACRSSPGAKGCTTI